MSIKQRLKDWYRGEYIPPSPNDPDSPLVIISVGRYKQPALAKLLKSVRLFWLAHWKWIITTCVAVITAFYAVRS